MASGFSAPRVAAPSPFPRGKTSQISPPAFPPTPRGKGHGRSSCSPIRRRVGGRHGGESARTINFRRAPSFRRSSLPSFSSDFSVGVLKVIDPLLDPAPYPAISGTSTGSLVGTLLATNQFTRLLESTRRSRPAAATPARSTAPQTTDDLRPHTTPFHPASNPPSDRQPPVSFHPSNGLFTPIPGFDNTCV
jgi:hypothetical protein